MFACVACDKVAGRNGDKLFAASLVALCVMLVGGIASVMHLAHPENILSALNHPTSGIFIEAVLVGLSLVCMLVFIILLKKDTSDGAQKAFAVIGAILGIVLSFEAGKSYMMASAGVWNTWLLPLGYLCTVIPAGAAAYLAVVAENADAESVKLPAMLLIIGGCLAAVMSLAYVLSAGAAANVAGLLYGGCILCGGVVPAVCGVMIMRKPEQARMFACVALVGALIGAVSFRCIMWAIYMPSAVGAPFITDFGEL